MKNCNDLKRAKKLLADGGYTCVAVNGDVIYSSTERGVKPLLRWLDERIDLCGMSVADKVVGKAAAFLYVLLGVSSLHACVISRPALDVLTLYGATVSYDILTDAIRNRTNTGYCPMESAVMDIDTPEAALRKIKETLSSLQSN